MKLFEARFSRVLVLVILVLGFALRIAYFTWAPPDYAARESDYDDIAQNMLAGKGFSIDSSYGLDHGLNLLKNPGRQPEMVPTASRTPLYPAFLAAIYKLFGRRIRLVYLIQTLIDLASATMLYFLALKITQDRRIALTSMALYILYMPFIEQVGTLLNETLFGSLVLLFTLAALFALELFSAPAFFLAGAALGLSALCRPTTFMFPAVFIPMTLIMGRTQLRRASFNSLAFLAGFALLIMPWMIRNYLVLDYFNMVGTRGGEQIFAANYGYLGEGGLRPMIPPDVREKLIDMTPEERDTFLVREGIKQMIGHPKRFIKNVIFKTFTFWTSIGMGKPGFFYHSSSRAGKEVSVFVAVLNPLLILASFVAFLWFRGKWVSKSLLPLVLLSYFYVVHLPIIAFVRYSMPVMPFLMMFAAVAMVRLFAQKGETTPS
ncbi:MAG: glycosyltransferase family 39 protein [Candidatus Coatesbacteria bacterium]|nr:glycosyltransferase family 39 protein [Candidatus Coatesbacteria bacterium]